MSSINRVLTVTKRSYYKQTFHTPRTYKSCTKGPGLFRKYKFPLVISCHCAIPWVFVELESEDPPGQFRNLPVSAISGLVLCMVPLP